MKTTMALLLGLFSLSAISSTELSYQTNIKVNKTVMDKDILLKPLIKLRTHLDFEAREMVAAKDEASVKPTYLNNLRSKLQGSKGLVRL